ncbi:MAG: leucine-rich repeat domain-containing protein, partial [Gemmatimonadetes bacterium]|nr:leucine-rich repeat domain-containing protein [Gemmatimonadota bacterium]
AVSDEGVCNRTPEVSAEIARKARVGSCAEVTDEMLGGVFFLDLGGKGITRLSGGDFTGLVALRGLYLNVNQLEKLPPDLFQGLPSLLTLWLGYNPLGELPPDIFSGLTNLSSLELGRAGLAALPTGVFDDLASLERLYLDGNSLESLPTDAFAALSNLRVLNLKENKLRELPPGLFKPTTRLEELYAGSNRFIHVPAGMFDGLSNLKRLDLSRNLIFDLSPRAFDGLVSLEELRLTGNQLDSLPQGLFAGLSSLEYARLHYNPGAPFPVHAGLVRADTSDLLAPAPARVRLRVPSGAPFAFRIPLLVQRGRASSRLLEVAVGDTVSQPVEVTSEGARAVHVVLGEPPDPPAEFDALRLVSGLPMVLFAETDNRTPVTRSGIPDHRLQAGGPAAELALAEYFDDPDGDSLLYEVASADPEVVRGSIAEGTLWLEPGAVDTTEIVVTATDPEGLRAVQRIRTWVVPAPDPGAFNIELIFGPGFTEEARAEIRRAAERWMEVVVGDLPDVPVDGTGPEYCTNRAPTPRLVGTIDDLLIYLHMRLGDRDAIGTASTCMEREESGLAVIGANWFSGVFHSPQYTYTFYETALHEIGHVVGIGDWEIEDRYTDPHFPGPLAVAAFDAAGGAGYQGGKVPVEDRGAWGGGGRWGHWRSRVMPDDIMSIGRGMLITPITVQALADLGHVVDVTKADPYTL